MKRVILGVLMVGVAVMGGADTNKIDIAGNIAEVVALTDINGDTYRVDLFVNDWTPGTMQLDLICDETPFSLIPSTCVSPSAYFPGGFSSITTPGPGSSTTTTYSPLVAFTGACERLRAILSPNGAEVTSITSATTCVSKP